MPEQDDKDLQPTFGTFHDDTLPESRRVIKKPRVFPKYGQQPKKDDDEEWWQNTMINGGWDYEQSKRSNK